MEKLITQISDVIDINNPDEINKEEINLDDLVSIIYNFDYSEKIRLKAFNFYYLQFNEDVMEIVNKLTIMYMLSKTKLIESFIKKICRKSVISFHYKLELAKNFENYKILDEIIQLSFSEVAIPCMIEAIYVLMKSKKYITNSKKYFCKVINNQDIEVHYRYKTILSIESRLDKSKDYIKDIMLSFIRYPDNSIRYKILAGQYLLQKYDLEDLFEEIQKYLVSFMTDNELDYNIRADVADVLLHMGDESAKSLARDIIILLGRRLGNVRTVFENNENVHHHSIEKSALKILEFLNNTPIPKDIKELQFPAIKKLILDVTSEKDLELVEVSLNRIDIDRAIYGNFGNTLAGILQILWKYIQSHKYKDELIKRLIEELVDMSGKCSTGYAYRLLNVLSGFDDFSIRISWEDQIAGNLMGRLNAFIKNIKDVKYKENIIVEMHLNKDGEITNRSNFRKLFREKLPQIKEEMYEEFKDYMDDSEFDLYLRRAVSKYEGHDFI
ncbi:hypothetical protein OAK19_06120 [Aureispira]|nr:hypothetical protein [Aureispira sp.]